MIFFTEFYNNNFQNNTRHNKLLINNVRKSFSKYEKSDATIISSELLIELNIEDYKKKKSKKAKWEVMSEFFRQISLNF